MIPRIAPVHTNWDRPVLSVMLPVRDPGPHLEQALGSVLAQGLHRSDAQVAVVDDGSSHDVEPRIRTLDPQGRVEFHRFDRPAGISGNLNRAIGLARGHLVHLLHQDDFVLPGFYARMRRAFERSPMAGMAFCRTRIVDDSGRCTKTSSGPQLWSGIARGWVAKISTRQRVQAPSAVVARTTYEHVGGYREDLLLALDWEMWVRISVRYPVWFESRACSLSAALPQRDCAAEAPLAGMAGRVPCDPAQRGALPRVRTRGPDCGERAVVCPFGDARGGARLCGGQDRQRAPHACAVQGDHPAGMRHAHASVTRATPGVHRGTDPSTPRLVGARDDEPHRRSRPFRPRRHCR